MWALAACKAANHLQKYAGWDPLSPSFNSTTPVSEHGATGDVPGKESYYCNSYHRTSAHSNIIMKLSGHDWDVVKRPTAADPSCVHKDADYLFNTIRLAFAEGR